MYSCDMDLQLSRIASMAALPSLLSALMRNMLHLLAAQRQGKNKARKKGAQADSFMCLWI